MECYACKKQLPEDGDHDTIKIRNQEITLCTKCSEAHANATYVISAKMLLGDYNGGKKA